MINRRQSKLIAQEQRNLQAQHRRVKADGATQPAMPNMGNPLMGSRRAAPAK